MVPGSTLETPVELEKIALPMGFKRWCNPRPTTPSSELSSSQEAAKWLRVESSVGGSIGNGTWEISRLRTKARPCGTGSDLKRQKMLASPKLPIGRSPSADNKP